MEPIAIDGAGAGGGGLFLRGALALSAVSGRPFRMERIRAGELRPGLRPRHLAAVRALALCCGAEVHGAFEGSPDLRFVPGPPAAGEFTFDIGTAGASTLLLSAAAPVLATAGAASRVTVLGGTHLAHSPSYHFLARHWAATVGRLGLRLRPELLQAGFAPKAEGRISCGVRAWQRPATLDLSARGPLLAVRGIAGAGKLRGQVAQRAADAARALLWEARRIESEWEVVELRSASPGSFLQVEAVFENGRAAFSAVGERSVRPELMGERAVRRLLRFLDDEGAVVDPWLADQLAVPMAIAGGGGRLVTSEVTAQLETAAQLLRTFEVACETWGRRGGPGGLQVGRWP
ncbi:MAG TPA: RNA 3'-terminal phosphate cyclase [Vicinamibacteria bacterium]|nr:RNA 3'-terminal phosphate cyclase [Vicinamibacteria bacterium]